MDGSDEISIKPTVIPIAVTAPPSASVPTPQPTQATGLSEIKTKSASTAVVDDTKERSQLMSGLHVAISLQAWVFDKDTGEPFFDEETVPGTIGCIAQTTDTNRLVALTCHHVVVPSASVFTTINNPGNQTEKSGVEVAGSYRLIRRDGDYVLQVKPEGESEYSDAKTKRVWNKSDGQRSDDFVVGHPTPGNCCGLGRDEFGRFYRSVHTRKVDAAAILLEEQQTETCILPLFLDGDLTDWRAEVLSKTGSDASAQTFKIQGSIPQELALADLQEQVAGSRPPAFQLSYKVFKYGFRTGYTSGLVRCIEYTRNPGQPDIAKAHPINETQAGSIPIAQPVPDDHIYIVPLDETTGQIGLAFAAEGDSGSAALNSQNQIVGLVSTGVRLDPLKDGTIAYGAGATLCKISAVMQALQVTIEPYDSAHPIRTVPDGNGDFQDSQARSDLGLTERSLRLPIVHSARRLLPRLRQLVNHNRRVTVAWHRNAGPQLGRGFVSALRKAGMAAPVAVDGKPSTLLLDRFLDVLSAECAPEERAELEALRPWLLQLPGRTARQMVELLETAQWR